jgi:hypothetical protein
VIGQHPGESHHAEDGEGGDDLDKCPDPHGSRRLRAGRGA